MTVKDLFLANAKLWDQIESSIRFLQPFSDLIHQIESDLPALGRCFEGLCLLDSHVDACCLALARLKPSRYLLIPLKQPGKDA
jgi:hypothetical protein